MRRIILIFTLILCAQSMLGQLRLRDAVYPYTIQEKGDTLTLHGMGIRKYIITDLYAGGLYTESTMATPSEIINSAEDMGIRLIILSKGIDRKAIIKTFRKGFKNTLGENALELQPKVDLLLSYFNTDVQRNDEFDFIYTEDRGLNVYKNNQPLGNIQGLEFKKALFNIWLGEKPVCKYIKNGMLAVEG